jgi:signal transduction histidine kinase
MVALSNMVAGVAHEINTPIGMALTGITHIQDESKNIKELYDSDNMSQEEFEEYLDDSVQIHNSIYINLTKAADLIKSFKQVAVDQSSDENRNFNLKNYVYEVLTSIQNETKKTNHHFNIDIDKDLEIYSNPGSFSQIITNFVMNSIIHGLKDINIGIIKIGAYRKEKNLILEYEDNGCGLSSEVKKKIFDPFYTTNRGNGGSGLGMNIVYNIITQNLNGAIEIESEEHKGIKFFMTIPLEDKNEICSK